jgi:hypothetical protein
MDTGVAVAFAGDETRRRLGLSPIHEKRANVRSGGGSATLMATSAHFHFRDDWRELKRGRPGHRFQDRYERARRDEHRCGAGQRIVLIVVAIVCLAIGAVLTVIPGPAILFFFVAGGLLASESRLIARFMDWSEVRIRKLLAWAKRRWRHLSGAGRITLMIIVAGTSAAGLLLSYRMLGN